MKKRKQLVLLVMIIGVVSTAAAWAAITGDVNGVYGIDLADAITALQVSAGSGGDSLQLDADVNGNNAIGMEEAVYALQVVAEIRDIATHKIPDSGRDGDPVINPMTYTPLPDGTVKDEVTGLI